MINGNALAHARTQRGISQRKLATLVGLNFQVIRRLENGGNDGNLLIRDFEKLCTTLNVQPLALLQADVNNETPDADDMMQELNLGQAKLLRRVQAGEDLRRSLTNDQRTLVLPSLLRIGLVSTRAGGELQLRGVALEDLKHPEAMP